MFLQQSHQQREWQGKPCQESGDRGVRGSSWYCKILQGMRSDLNLPIVNCVQSKARERRSVRHITMVEKISGSQPSFLTETAICIVERWMKSMGYRLFPSASVQRKVIHAHLFFFCHICRKTGRSRILLPWQRYIVFPLYWRICRVGYSTLYIYSALFFLLSLVKQTSRFDTNSSSETAQQFHPMNTFLTF